MTDSATLKFELERTSPLGAFLIEASAGTGKTYSLTRLVLRLLVEEEMTIDQVLMVTYTNAAAAELRARLRDLLLEIKNTLQSCQDRVPAFKDEMLNKLFEGWLHRKIDPVEIKQRIENALDGLDDCCISTIHSFCQKMLKEHGFSGSQSGHYELNDNVDDLLDRAIGDFLRTELQCATDTLREEILREDDPLEVLKEILNAYFDAPQNPEITLYAQWKKIDIQKEEKAQASKARKKKLPSAQELGLDSEEMQAFLLRFLRTVPHQVEQLKISEGVCTYSDLISGVERELQEEDFVKEIRAQFRAVLIDEFQDTDPVQYKIFSTLFLEATQKDPSRSLIFVGDPKQSIYRFRGADISTYDQARRDIGRIYQLATNYRSNPALLSAINHYFADGDDSASAFCTDVIRYKGVDAGSEKMPLYEEHHGQKVYKPVFEFWLRENTKDSLNTENQRLQEAQLIAQDIDQLLHSGVMIKEGQPLTAKDIVILVRRHKDADAVIEALAKRQIRCLSFARGDVFESDEADEILKILSSMEVPQDIRRLKQARLTRIMGESLNEISPQAFAKATETIVAEKKALLARETIEKASAIFQKKGLASAFAFIFEACNTQARLLPLNNGEKWLNNYQHIIELLQQQSRHLKTLSGLTRWFIKAKNTPGGEARETRIENDENLITIMTIHKSKGLEYPIVYLVGAWNNKKRNPYPPKHVCRDIREKATRLTISYSAQNVSEINPEINFNDEIETIRLAYVAMTRAAQRLVLPMMLVQNANASQFKGPYYSALTKKMDPKLQDISLAREGLFKKIYEEVKTKSLPTTQPPIESLIIAKDIGANDKATEPSPLADDELQETLTTALASPIASSWHQSSYSAIVRAANHSFDLSAQAEKEDTADDAEVNPIEETPLPTNDILHFSRGAESGTFLHALFERIDFGMVKRAQFDNSASDNETLLKRTEIISRPYVQNFQDLDHAMLVQLMKDVLCCSLFKDREFKLCDISENHKLREMTFTMSVKEPLNGRKAVDTESLKELLSFFNPKYHLSHLMPKSLKGFLTGAIDMIFMHDGQFFVLDWKSNFLGSRISDYQIPAMQKAMAVHDYYLQYLIYCVALKRYLRSRKIELNEKSFGGVIYAFIRGMRIDNTEPYGVYFEKPSLALIDCLDDFFMHGFDAKTVSQYAQRAQEEQS